MIFRGPLQPLPSCDSANISTGAWLLVYRSSGRKAGVSRNLYTNVKDLGMRMSQPVMKEELGFIISLLIITVLREHEVLG